MYFIPETYTEGLKKVQIAQNSRYAYTGESDDDHGRNMSAMMEQEIKSKMLKKRLTEMKQKMKVNPIGPQHAKPRGYVKGKRTKNCIITPSNLQSIIINFFLHLFSRS